MSDKVEATFHGRDTDGCTELTCPQHGVRNRIRRAMRESLSQLDDYHEKGNE